MNVSHASARRTSPLAPPPPPRRPSPIVPLLCPAALASGCSGSGSPSATPSGSPSESTARAAQAAPAAADSLQDDYQRVIKDVLPSVVQIRASSDLGSGVVYDDKGHIVTNAHVVGDE